MITTSPKIDVQTAVQFMGILHGQRNQAYDLIVKQKKVIDCLMKVWIKNPVNQDQVLETLKDIKEDEQRLIINMSGLTEIIERPDYSDIDTDKLSADLRHLKV